MAVFLGTHHMPDGMPIEDAESGSKEMWQSYCKAAKEQGLTPIGAVVSIEKKVGYCQTEAGSIDEVKKAHETANIPLDDLYEVKAFPPS